MDALFIENPRDMHVIEAKEPFLDAEHGSTSSDDGIGFDRESDDLTLVIDDQERHESDKSKLRFPYYATNWIVLVSNLLFFFWAVWRIFNGGSHCPEDPFLLPGKAVQYKNHLFTTEIGHAPVTSAEKGFTGQVLRVSKEELETAGIWRDDIVELENGGYMASLGVMHELHCLDWMFNQYSASNLSMFERDESEIQHLDYCLHVLQESNRCRGKLNVGSVYWNVENVSEIERSCIDWPGLANWMQPRRLKVSEGAGTVEGIRSPLGIISHEYASDYGDLI